MSYWRVRNRKFSEYGKGKTCRKMAEKSPKPMRDINAYLQERQQACSYGYNNKTAKHQRYILKTSREKSQVL